MFSIYAFVSNRTTTTTTTTTTSIKCDVLGDGIRGRKS